MIKVTTKSRQRGLYSALLILCMTMFSMAFPVTAAAAKAASAKPVKVAVVDKSNTKSAQNAVRFAKDSGMKAVLVTSLAKAKPSKYDGLIVPGGGDVDPRLYGAKRSSHTYGTSYARSRLQIRAVKKFARAGKPVLGLCGGEQIINVAFGGNLKQHIGWHTGWRKVKISKKSWLRSVYGASASVYHFHHQCVNKLGKDLVATMWAEDNGEVEALEHKTLPVYGLQWHPEHMGGAGQKAGRKFASICKKYRKKAKKAKEAKRAQEVKETLE